MWSKCIFEIDSRIDFLPNLRQTQNTRPTEWREMALHSMKLDVCRSGTLRRNYTSKRNVEAFQNARKTFLPGMFVIIMVVTFLIEFRLPNFSQKHPPADGVFHARERRVINRFPFDFSLQFSWRRLAGKFFVRLQLWTRSSSGKWYLREDFCYLVTFIGWSLQLKVGSIVKFPFQNYINLSLQTWNSPLEISHFFHIFFTIFGIIASFTSSGKIHVSYFEHFFFIRACRFDDAK